MPTSRAARSSETPPPNMPALLPLAVMPVKRAICIASGRSWSAMPPPETLALFWSNAHPDTKSDPASTEVVRQASGALTPAPHPQLVRSEQPQCCWAGRGSASAGRVSRVVECRSVRGTRSQVKYEATIESACLQRWGQPVDADSVPNPCSVCQHQKKTRCLTSVGSGQAIIWRSLMTWRTPFFQVKCLESVTSPKQPLISSVVARRTNSRSSPVICPLMSGREC